MLVVVLSATACQKEELTGPDSPGLEERSAIAAPTDIDVIGTKWTLMSLGSNTAVSMREAPWFLLDEQGTVSGNTACNTFTGTYRLEQDALLFTRSLQTRIHCPATAQLELDFLEALRVTDHYRMDGGRLVLLIGNHELARFEGS